MVDPEQYAVAASSAVLDGEGEPVAEVAGVYKVYQDLLDEGDARPRRPRRSVCTTGRGHGPVRRPLQYAVRAALLHGRRTG